MVRYVVPGILLFFFSASAIAREGFFVELFSRYDHINFYEWGDGYVINEETGAIPVNGFSVRYQQRNQFYFEFIHTSGGNAVDYQGYTQKGSLLQTQTEYGIDSNQYIFGKKFETTVVYLGYEQYKRDRTILPTEFTQPLTEHWQQKQGFVGFKQSIINSKNWLVEFRFNAKMAFSSYMDVDFSDQYDTSGVHMGVDYTITPSLYIGRSLPHEWMLALNLMYEFTEIQESEAVELTRNGEAFGAEFFHPYTELETYAVGLTLSKGF